MEGLTESLAIRMKAFNVKLTSVVPGPVATSINDNIVEGNRLPSRKKVDPITREQLKILSTHQKHYFEEMFQTTEEITDIVQKIIEMDLYNGPVRFLTSEDVRLRTAMKFSDIGAVTWMNFIRKIIEEPIIADSKPKHDESQI
ncbi:uncharacterized protein LOC115925296 [Strongylocentrotus purpuratus]|uniref:Uncharacterized protein n=1 Tax=Strongylocentrotus purpuratus TaxID=7668 RepID=A0A7M7P3F0_STRPU|nr:uncharacterized protein LOC115925296 [Strongylocentrotus purpuratus]